jgi:hypothetical protein
MRRETISMGLYRIKVAGIAGIVLSWGAARADIGPKPTTTGSTIGPGKDLEGIEVSMAAEEVALRLTKVEEEKDRLEVTAVFTMRNPGPAVTLETGFPVGIFKGAFASFSVKIGGKRGDFDLVNRGASPKEAARGPNLRAQTGPPAEPDYWYVWSAMYPSGDSRHEVRYTVNIIRHNPGGFTGYVLHTGAAWKGPIGKATVVLTFGAGYSPDHVYSITPKTGARREKDRYVWDLSDLEPTEKDDIDIGYSTESNAESLRRVKAEAKTTWLGKQNLVRLLARRPKDWLRSRMTPEELDEYLDAVARLIADGKEREGRVVFPDPSAPFGADRYPKRAGWNDDARSADSILGWMETAAQAVEQYPESDKAREVLARFVALGEKVQAGQALLGDKVLQPPAKLSEWMEKARKAMKGEGR